MNIKKNINEFMDDNIVKNNRYINIGEASKLSGIHSKMIRHYETTGVLSSAKRSDAGYRLYNEIDIQNGSVANN